MERIHSNGALCDRCDAALAVRAIIRKDKSYEYVCVACLSQVERIAFWLQPQKEYHI